MRENDVTLGIPKTSYMKKDNWTFPLLSLLLLLIIIVSSEESDYRHSALIGWNTANT